MVVGSDGFPFPKASGFATTWNSREDAFGRPPFAPFSALLRIRSIACSSSARDRLDTSSSPFRNSFPRPTTRSIERRIVDFLSLMILKRRSSSMRTLPPVE